MSRFTAMLVRILASRKFFVFTVILLVLQALWIALSFKYPMLWDEYYHFGIIQYYGHHLSPIITQQPHSLDIYGNVARSPKYLYQYLMSFPYRLVSAFTANQVAQIIFLRLLNIAMFAGGLVAFRQAMLRLTKSKALVHFVLFIVVLLPLSSLLAAQINYDNMEFLMAGVVFYWAFRFIQSERLEAKWFLLVLGGGLIASVVKYTFLPILVAVLFVMLLWAWRQHHKNSFKLLWQSYRRLGRWSAIGLSLLVLVGAGLSIERFGVNLIEYHSVDPVCSKVLNVERCQEFSPFEQVYTYTLQKQAAQYKPPHGIVGYTFLEWFRQMYEQYFTTGTQLAPGNFIVVNSLKIPFITMLVVGGGGLICFLVAAPKLLRRTEVWLVLASMAVLAGALWVVNYQAYTQTGYPLAIQGRYLTPIIPLGLLLGGMGVTEVLGKRRNLKAALATVALIGLIWGGGLITHIVLSQPDWYWHNNSVIRINQDVRSILKPLVF